mmetsp:Transcript_19077/g.40228  ORF Transcript_19077/g.40228 Transcript_19077/m.40228 type:complete len:86 (-) Transcript_19077:135-392(-)
MLSGADSPLISESYGLTVTDNGLGESKESSSSIKTGLGAPGIKTKTSGAVTPVLSITTGHGPAVAWTDPFIRLTCPVARLRNFVS